MQRVLVGKKVLHGFVLGFLGIFLQIIQGFLLHINYVAQRFFQHLLFYGQLVVLVLHCLQLPFELLDGFPLLLNDLPI